MKMPEYVLRARGSVIKQDLDIIAPEYVYEDTVEWCKTTAASLFPAGYYSFDLFRIGVNGAADVYVDTFRVEETKPYVWRKSEQ